MPGPIFEYRVQQRFIEHLFKDSLIRLGSRREYEARKSILDAVARDVSQATYLPQPDIGLLSMPKGGGVPRFVPVLSLRDYIVYYACVASVDEALTALATEDTFGGWRLGGGRRQREGSRARRLIADAIDDHYGPPSAFNPAAWVENWNEFWKLLVLIFDEAEEEACFVSFDVANFYDSIDLPRLERLIRDASHEGAGAIELLFLILRTWNSRINRYSGSSKGLPQDLVGECSRVLANAYLTPFDAATKAHADQAGGRYARYADDMVIRAPNRQVAETLL